MEDGNGNVANLYIALESLCMNCFSLDKYF